MLSDCRPRAFLFQTLDSLRVLSTRWPAEQLVCHLACRNVRNGTCNSLGVCVAQSPDYTVFCLEAATDPVA
eukprot:6108938-Amphidinium_carterae.3